VPDTLRQLNNLTAGHKETADQKTAMRSFVSVLPDGTQLDSEDYFCLEVFCGMFTAGVGAMIFFVVSGICTGVVKNPKKEK
jgi:hypothetical protein